MKDDKHKHREPMPLYFSNWHQGPIAMEKETDLLRRLYEKYPNGKPDEDGYTGITAKPILTVKNY